MKAHGNAFGVRVPTGTEKRPSSWLANAMQSRLGQFQKTAVPRADPKYHWVHKA